MRCAQPATTCGRRAAATIHAPRRASSAGALVAVRMAYLGRPPEVTSRSPVASGGSWSGGPASAVAVRPDQRRSGPGSMSRAGRPSVTARGYATYARPSRAPAWSGGRRICTRRRPSTRSAHSSRRRRRSQARVGGRASTRADRAHAWRRDGRRRTALHHESSTRVAVSPVRLAGRGPGLWMRPRPRSRPASDGGCSRRIEARDPARAARRPAGDAGRRRDVDLRRTGPLARSRRGPPGHSGSADSRRSSPASRPRTRGARASCALRRRARCRAAVAESRRKTQRVCRDAPTRDARRRATSDRGSRARSADRQGRCSGGIATCWRRPRRSPVDASPPIGAILATRRSACGVSSAPRAPSIDGSSPRRSGR